MSLEIAQAVDAKRFHDTEADYTNWRPSIQIADSFSKALLFSLPPLQGPPNLGHYWESVLKDAKEFGYPELSGEVFACAKLLFPDVLSGYHGTFDIYPTEDGEIVLDAYVQGEEYSSSILLICRPDGQVLCSVVIGEDTRGELFSGDDVCVNSFIEQAFSDLQKEMTQRHVRFSYIASEAFEYHAPVVGRSQAILE